MNFVNFYQFATDSSSVELGAVTVEVMHDDLLIFVMLKVSSVYVT